MSVDWISTRRDGFCARGIVNYSRILSDVLCQPAPWSLKRGVHLSTNESSGSKDWTSDQLVSPLPAGPTRRTQSQGPVRVKKFPESKCHTSRRRPERFLESRSMGRPTLQMPRTTVIALHLFSVTAFNSQNQNPKIIISVDNTVVRNDRWPSSCRRGRFN